MEAPDFAQSYWIGGRYVVLLVGLREYGCTDTSLRAGLARCRFGLLRPQIGDMLFG